ncbi:MAG TPA: biosynthetic-type acetolactate synthase large subunit [Clostridiales bacterium]|nr:biosynthetic-type acetolactate synthase large subunit [Clostridiales bacterium]
MKITGAQAMVRILEMEKVSHIFGYPGAAICPFYNVLVDSTIKHILTRHEQGAAHGASGYARATGKTGVCVATSGPGATNLITGIATAYMDSIPIVAITGQVPTNLIGRDVFQEADITGATAPFCKHNYLVKNARDLPGIMKEAFHIASTGRPGPVLIDVPIDIQNEYIDFSYPASVDIRGYKPTYKGHPIQIKRIADAIRKSKSPVICAGGGVISGDACSEMMQLVEKCSIPVVTTLMGIGAIPSNHHMYLGMLGSHGSYSANYAINNADLVFIMGARVGDRAIVATNKIAKQAVIIHVDIDPAEIGKNIDVAIPAVGDVKSILEDLLDIVDKGSVEAWNITIRGVREKQDLKVSNKNNVDEEGTVKPSYLLRMLSDMVDGSNTIVTTEVGQNQIWAANNMSITKPGKFITSGGMGTMGYGLPAAIGAKVGCPDNVVIAVSGDGSFQMSMQELGTIKQNKLGVKIIIFNNSRLGMVRELQKMQYCGRYSQVFLDENPDFVKLAEAYDISGERIDKNSEIGSALERLLADDKPYLLECIVDPEEPTL